MFVVLVVAAVVTSAGLVATITRAEAASCTNLACNGKRPTTMGCTPGTEFGAVYFLGGNARIAMRRSMECGTPRWARLVWDGAGASNPPIRFNFRIQRREYIDVANSWVITHSQSGTTDGSTGTFVTSMVADTDNANAQFRASARYAVATGVGTWAPWSSWTHTAWRLS